MYTSKFFASTQRYFAAVTVAVMLCSAVPTAAFAQVFSPDIADLGEFAEYVENSPYLNGGETTPEDSEAVGDSGAGAAGDTEGGAAGDTEGEGGTGVDEDTDSGVDEGAGEPEAAAAEVAEDEEGGGNDGEPGADGETDEETASEDGDNGTADNPDGGTGEDAGDADADTPEGATGEGELPEDGASDGEVGDTTGNGEEGGEGTADAAGADGEGAADGAAEEGDNGGVEGSDGASGEDGGVTVEEEPPENPDPVTIISDNRVANDATPDDGEEVTGSQTVNGHRNKVVIETGEATAQAEITNDVNSGDIKSLIDLDTFDGDLDNYYFNATGTNDADVTNTGSVLALTGDNAAITHGGPAEAWTGNAYAALNIANVVNSSVVNSDGFLYLGNRILEPNQSLDLTDFFFPDPDGELARANDCDLLSCVAEDIYYTFSQSNTATVTNNASLEAVTGENLVDTETSFSNIYTGEAYAGANIVNVVNTNIVDSNYRFLTMNAMGDLDGDLLLPTQELFEAFYGRPNGMTQLEDAEDIHAVIDNTNDANVENGLDAVAETGLNDATASVQPDIYTGTAEAESNILDKINQNIFGGDVMYLLIRVHGSWSGEVRGLPDGLAWQWTPSGVLIYNEGAEIAPSALLPYDVDSYNAEITDFNAVTINNNIDIDAITGRNEANGAVSTIVTGDAFASANVMNVANTNVIGANWTFAVINIFGDFDGDVAFSEIDLSLEGDVSGPDPLGPSDVLTYTYTVHNNSTVPATNVVLEQTLENATADGTAVKQIVNFGDLAPGASVTTELTAAVDPDLPVGTSSVNAVAVVNSDEAEATPADNAVLLSLDAAVASVGDGGSGEEGGGTGDDGSGDNGDGGSGDDDESGDSGTGDSNDTGGSSPSPSGGKGGSPKNKTKSIDRTGAVLGASFPTSLVVLKESNVDAGEIVKAGQTVDYTITVINGGDTVYDAVVYDSLVNPIGAVLNEQSWELGTVLADEEIVIEYSTDYSLLTPTGEYTNTASIEAYERETGKADGDDPMDLVKAVNTIEIEGVDLGIGNIGVVAYYPGAAGRMNALVTWETSKPASGQVFFSPTSWNSKYNPLLPNYGYQRASFRFNNPKTKHYMILRDLMPGVNYSYKIRSTHEDKLAVRGDYTFTVPTNVQGLAVALPNGQLAQLAPQVAGAAVSRPVIITPATVPTTPPAPASYTPPTPPVPKEEPVSPPAAQPTADNGNQSGGGFFGGVAKKVFGFFR